MDPILRKSLAGVKQREKETLAKLKFAQKAALQREEVFFMANPLKGGHYHRLNKSHCTDKQGNPVPCVGYPDNKKPFRIPKKKNT